MKANATSSPPGAPLSAPEPNGHAAAQAAREDAGQLELSQYAVDRAHDLVATVDASGRFLHVTATLCRWTGRSAEELATMRVWDGIFEMDPAEFDRRWAEAKQHGGVVMETAVISRDGGRLPVEMSATHVALQGREALCTISRDLRPRVAADQEKLRLQEQLSESQRLESLGVLAGGIAHDFNNLLTAILGNASLARDCLDHRDTARAMLCHIDEAANQAAGLCRQMLAYAGRGQLIPEPVDLSAMVARSEKLLEIVGDSARLEFKLAPELPPTTADASQLRQLLLNLVHNAAESISHPEGRIVISTYKVQVDRALAASARVRTDIPDGDGVVLSVSDNGCGIAPENLQRIFEPFFTTKFTGRGLGLPAVLGIVRAHRALLHVESTVEKGSTFRVTFSAAPPPVRSTAAPPSAQPRRQSGPVLVVDDEQAVRQVAAEVLQRLGFSVETAENAESALMKLGPTPNRFSLLVVDMTMPGMDGPAALREFRHRGVTAPAILMSGFSEVQVRERIAPDHVAEFLQKPFDVAALRLKVERALNATT